MFKKCLISAVLFTMSSTFALCAVPVFSSTDIANESNLQQMELAPVSGYSAPNVENNIKPQNNLTQYNQIQNENYRNAIQNLEGAQVGIREILVDYKVKYNESKVRYDAVKAERDILGKQVRSYEKKVKEIERAKKNIAKNIIE